MSLCSFKVSFEHYKEAVAGAQTIRVEGKVTQLIGLLVEGHGPGSSIGAVCDIFRGHGGLPLKAEVVGFRQGKTLLMPLGDIKGIGPGSKIISRGESATAKVGPELLGRVIDGLGMPIDGKGRLNSEKEYPLYASPINPLSRRRISEPLDVGIRAINGLLTCGKGQRIGIFSGSGVGKSVLLGMMARFTNADVNVIALIGERGREVREFVERDLGEGGLKRSAVVAATSDQSPLIRMRGAFMATAIAEYFRDCGLDVLLMMDSITRFAMAQREVGLAIGEPPTTKGYTPSVFALLPKLLERGGTSNSSGTITALYNVLVEGDDMNEPVADAVRAILDGHIVLSRELASKNHYPSIDILNSKSRVMIDIVGEGHQEMANKVCSILATYKEAEDLINIGAYVHGSNPRIDHAINMIGSVNAFLKQGVAEKIDFERALRELSELCH